MGIPSAEDTLVREIVRLILESIYESTFFRIPVALNRGKTQQSGFAAKARNKEADAVFRNSGKRR